MTARVGVAGFYWLSTIVTPVGAFYFATGTGGFWGAENGPPLTMATIAACLVSMSAVRGLSARRARRFERGPRLLETIAGIVVGFAVIELVLSTWTGAGFPPMYLLTAMVLVGLSTLTGEAYLDRCRRMDVAVVPHGRIAEVERLPGLECHVLDKPERLPVAAVVVDRHHRHDPTWSQFLADCELRSIPVIHAGALHERLAGCVSLRYVRDPVLEGLRPDPWMSVAKRVSELVLIVVMLPILLVVMALTALAIRLDSPGPVLFWQERVGLHGKVFRLVKFRSMRLGADSDGARFAQSGDARVTAVGRFIRKVRLDELPQILNVVRGEMSLIGPRPEQVPFVRHYEQRIPFYAYRHTMRPGLTGWAQVRAGYSSDDEGTYRKLQHDLFYVKNFSPWLDAWILVLTLRTIVTGFGAR